MYTDDRDVILRLPKEMNDFFKEQEQFLAKTGEENPKIAIIKGGLDFFNELILARTRADIPISIEGIGTYSGFSIADAIMEAISRSNAEEYQFTIRGKYCDIMDEAKRFTACTTDEEVLISSLCLLRWVVDIYQARLYIFLRYNVGGIESSLPYHHPLLDAYKSRLLH